MPVIVHVKVVDIPVVTQRLFPMVQVIFQTLVVHQLQSLDNVFDALVVQVKQIPRVQAVRRRSRSHSCSR